MNYRELSEPVSVSLTYHKFNFYVVFLGRKKPYEFYIVFMEKFLGVNEVFPLNNTII